MNDDVHIEEERPKNIALVQSLWGKVDTDMGDGRPTQIRDMSREQLSHALHTCYCARGNLCDTCLLMQERIKEIDAATPTICPRCGGEWNPKGGCVDCRLSPVTLAISEASRIKDREGMGSRPPNWEKPSQEGMESAVCMLLMGMGQNPNSESLKDTPARVVKTLQEMTSGYGESPEEILSKQFDEESDELILLKDIEFTSLCEHHLLPFGGVAHVGYIPGESGKVVGLSKLARLVDCFARRLQMQERMTREIGQSLMTCLAARGTGVVVRAHHSCMGCRGVRKSGAIMVTSCCLGLFREDSSLRSEFLSLCGERGRDGTR